MPLSLVDNLKYLGLMKYDGDAEFASLTEAQVVEACKKMVSVADLSEIKYINANG